MDRPTAVAQWTALAATDFVSTLRRQSRNDPRQLVVRHQGATPGRRSTPMERAEQHLHPAVSETVILMFSRWRVEAGIHGPLWTSCSH